MTRPQDHLRGLLETGLDDTFAILPVTQGPVIPRGKHGLMLYRSALAPLTGSLGNGRLRTNTFTLNVVSPLTDLGNAQAELNDALDAVVDVLETDDAVLWSDAVFESYNGSLWTYTITLTIASTHTPEVDEPVGPASTPEPEEAQ